MTFLQPLDSIDKAQINGNVILFRSRDLKLSSPYIPAFSIKANDYQNVFLQEDLFLNFHIPKINLEGAAISNFSITYS